MKTLNLSLIAGLLFLTIASCKKDDNNDNPQTLYGTAVALGGDSVRSFVTVDKNGVAQTIGLQFGENALNNLSTDTMPEMPMFMYPVPLPKFSNATGIDHIELDWNPFGHTPTAVYGVPHFDFHFFYVKPAAQAAVVPGPDTVSVAAQFIPKNYMSTVVAVPYMGVHWVDTTSAELRGSPFTATFIYGFYHGEMTFIEPMIAKSFLQTHPDFTADIKQPEAFQQSNYYPTSYQIKFDATKHAYVLTLLNLVKH